MTAVVRICAAGMLGLWVFDGIAQEAADENSAATDAQQEVAAEAATTAAGAAAEADTVEQPEVIVDAGATEPGEAFPEVPPLDELFVPSQNIRADEPVTFPVDF